MSLIHRTPKKTKEESTAVAETAVATPEVVQPYIEESEQARRARLRQMEKDEAEARAKQIEAASAPTRNVNAEYFAKQEALAKQAAEQNAKNKAAQKTQEQINAESVAAAQSALGPRPVVNKPPEGFTDPYGLVPSERKAPVVRKPEPAKYPSSDPRNGMPDYLILSMGMELDPRLPALKK